MLIDTIKEQQVQARKERNTQLAQLLTTFYSEAAMIGKNDGGRKTTDKEVHATAKKFLKNAEEMLASVPIEDYRADKAMFEIGILCGFLPTQLPEPELFAAIEAIIQAKSLSSIKDIGVVMKELKSNFDGQYDGERASNFIKELLK